ncbi:MAG TPA: ribose 5-phosphate isomerase B [Candidatus Obscuribacterales bacterium]
MSHRIALGADHGGYVLKEKIKEFLQEHGNYVQDFGTFSEESVDYPDYALLVGEAIVGGTADLGILICGSGVGVTVAANKIRGIRAGMCHDTFSAHQGREDDDTNVLCLGARVIGPNLALDIVKTWLDAKFSGAERHIRRLRKVHEIEKKHLAPASSD